MILRLILGGLWKPILAVLALLGVYGKGRADAKAKARTEAMQDTIKAHEARNEADRNANADPDPRGRLRSDWRR